MNRQTASIVTAILMAALAICIVLRKNEKDRTVVILDPGEPQVVRCLLDSNQIAAFSLYFTPAE